MGCGTSIGDNEVKSPGSGDQKKTTEPKQQQPTHVHPVKNNNQIEQLNQIKTEKTIMNQGESNTGLLTVPKQQQESSAITIKQNARLFLFGQSKQQRKIVQFEALPSPHIQILLSRTHTLPPVKYQPSQIILQQSQELTSSNLYISTSHPPYNYMFATFIRHNTIFLCGGVNYGFDNVSNQAFLFQVRDDPTNLNTPQKPDKSMSSSLGVSLKKKRSVGNNLMGSKFQRLPLMKTRRYSHMGVFLKTGKLGYVYVIGGRTENDSTSAKCERYSIEQNKWNQIASMNAPRSTGFAIIVNKKIYVFGGYTSEGKRSKKIQRYNTSFDSWQVLNIKLHKGIETGIVFPCPCPSPSSSLPSPFSSSNQIFIVGGNVETGAIKTCLRINFQNQTYIWDSDLKKQRLLQKGIALLQDNICYVLGGDFSDTIQKYSYKDKTWKIVNGLNYSECVSPDEINAFTLAQETIQLNFETNVNSANNANSVNSVNVKENEGVNSGDSRFIFGTDDYPCIYQLNTVKWVLKKKNVPMALRLRCHMTTTKIKQGKIFIAGGIDCYHQKPSRAAYIYYSNTNKCIEIPKMKQKKYLFSACSLSNSVYIFGGQDAKQGKILSSCQRYDVDTDKWVSLPDMPKQRTQCKSVVSPNGKVLLFGGTDCLYQSVYQIDIYDPVLNCFASYEGNFPLGCQIKFVEFTGRTSLQKIGKNYSGQFQFLDQQSKMMQNSNNSNLNSNQNEGNLNTNLKQQKQKQKQKNQSTITISKNVNSNPNNKNEKQLSMVQQQQLQHNIIVFGYNSYKKQDQAYILSMSLDFQSKTPHITYDQKFYKLYHHSLVFSCNNTNTNNNNNNPNINNNKLLPPLPASNINTNPNPNPNLNLNPNTNSNTKNYYLISNKGVFKWDQSTKQVNSQIVINQMHMLQMPLDKFCVV